MYDNIIIGNGPAGLSAALYLGREGYKVLVIGLDSILEKVDSIENYLGIKQIAGTDLLKVAKEQVEKVGVKITEEKVLTIYNDDKMFLVITNENNYTSKSIILALGAKKDNIKIKNIDNFIGKGVSYCVSCEGFFYKNKDVGVIGNSEYSIEVALNLKNYTENITIFTNGKDIKITEKYKKFLANFNIDSRKINRLEGEERLSHIIFENNENIKLDGIFIANETPNIDDLSNSLGLFIKDKKVVVDKNNMTNVKGVFVCGDMLNDFKQVSTAVASGAIAGHSCIKYLIDLNLK